MSEIEDIELIRMQKRYDKFFRKIRKIENKTSDKAMELKKFNFDIKYIIYDILKERQRENLSFSELQYLLDRATECYSVWQEKNSNLKEVVKCVIDNEIMNKKEKEIKVMKRNRKTLKEQVNEKLLKEYKKFIKELKGKTPKEIIEVADKIVYMEELKAYIEEKKLTIIEARAILNTATFLECMYEISRADIITYNEELEKHVNEDLAMVVECYKTERKNKNEKRK